MKLRLTAHAQARSRERKIRINEMKAVLQNPLKDWPSRDAADRRCYEGMVNGRRIGVTVVEGTTPMIVVTVWSGD